MSAVVETEGEQENFILCLTRQFDLNIYELNRNTWSEWMKLPTLGQTEGGQTQNAFCPIVSNALDKPTGHEEWGIRLLYLLSNSNHGSIIVLQVACPLQIYRSFTLHLRSREGERLDAVRIWPAFCLPRHPSTCYTKET